MGARKFVRDKYAADFMVVDIDIVRPFYFDVDTWG